jgi:prepilin-type N-terminal cleavage/methylation domain-containing protein
MKNHKGFSLVELLVVVIIIAIVAAIAIPNLLASRRAANEASAINSLRTIHGAQSTYLSLLGNNSAYADLTALSGAGLLDPLFTGASFVKSGYTVAASVTSTANGYCSTAAPAGAGGTRIFGNDQNGVIHQGVTATACDTGTLTIGAGVPIQ